MKNETPGLRPWLPVFLLAALLATSACHSGGLIGSKQAGSVGGRVVDEEGRAIAEALVTAPPAFQTTSNAEGSFLLPRVPPASRVAVTFEAPGYRGVTRVVAVTANERSAIRAVLARRSEPSRIDAAAGGEISFAGDGLLVLAPGSLVDGAGRPASGPAWVSLTPIEVGSLAGRSSAPGDFTARMRDGSTRRIESFGMVDVMVADGEGRRLDLAPGSSAKLAIPIPESLRTTAPPQVGLYRFEPASGFWVERGEVERGPRGLTYNGTIDSVNGGWNADDPIETTCVMVRVLDLLSNPPNQPIAGITVDATGVDYAAVSSGQTDANGLVCLLVKRNAQVTLQASSPTDHNRASQNQTITSPDVASGADACGDCFECPPVATLGLDLIVH